MAKQKQVVEAGMRVHTSAMPCRLCSLSAADKLGGLMERLELLQQEEQAWVKRYIPSSLLTSPYDPIVISK